MQICILPVINQLHYKFIKTFNWGLRGQLRSRKKKKIKIIFVINNYYWFKKTEETPGAKFLSLCMYKRGEQICFSTLQLLRINKKGKDIWKTFGKYKAITVGWTER